MGWSSNEQVKNKKRMETTTKILIAITICLLLIISLIIILLDLKKATFKVYIDKKVANNITKDYLITKIDGKTYIDIERFAKLIGYEYHKGEYKTFTIEEDKCYVQGVEETATFYANDNKICKLPVNQLEDEYREYTVENTIKIKNKKMYATMDAISLAFNVSIGETEEALTILTLDYLVKHYNNKVMEWGYSDISKQSFENKKAILYGYLIVNKEKGLYKIIDNENSKEIVADKYNAIEFSENTQEFLVTNSLGQVGIINLDGTTKIEPTYDSIAVLNKQLDMYLIEKNKKFGVIKSGNITLIVPEYDRIGINDSDIIKIADSKYFILDTLIPVCKNDKWGAVDKNGNIVLKLEYEGFGCPVTTVEINQSPKAVQPLISIKRCNGVVVKLEGKYGVVDLKGNELVPIAVDSIYAIENVEDEDNRYFMKYNGKELNVIERLVIAGLIKPTEKEEEESDKITAPISNTVNEVSNTTNNENSNTSTTNESNNTINENSNTNTTNQSSDTNNTDREEE